MFGERSLWLVTSKEHQGPARPWIYVCASRSLAKWPVGNFVTLSPSFLCESSAFIRTDKTSQIFAWRDPGRTDACVSCSGVVCLGNVASGAKRHNYIDSKVTATPPEKKTEEQEVLIFSTIAPPPPHTPPPDPFIYPRSSSGLVSPRLTMRRFAHFHDTFIWIHRRALR